jgi:uncharacterized membrane protein YdcZ (DUF606 family)
VAAGLFAWGLANSIDRGDSITDNWTTYVLGALVVASGANIAIRSTALAKWALAIVALLTLAVLVAAFGPNPMPTLAVARSLIFFALLAVAGVMQCRPRRGTQ